MDLKNINYLILLKNDEFVVINILRFSMRIGFRMALIKRRIPIKRHVITGILNLATHTAAGGTFQAVLVNTPLNFISNWKKNTVKGITQLNESMYNLIALKRKLLISIC